MATPLLARTFAVDYASAARIGSHHHPGWAQLMSSLEGVMSVDTASGSWVVPPGRAIWVPAGCRHDVACSSGHTGGNRSWRCEPS